MRHLFSSSSGYGKCSLLLFRHTPSVINLTQDSSSKLFPKFTFTSPSFPFLDPPTPGLPTWLCCLLSSRTPPLKLLGYQGREDMEILLFKLTCPWNPGPGILRDVVFMNSVDLITIHLKSMWRLSQVSGNANACAYLSTLLKAYMPTNS